MDISAGLIGKIAAGGTAAAATTTAGLIYGEDIVELFIGSKDTLEKNSLGLPSAFTWPTDSNATTSILTAQDLKKINFDGKAKTELKVSGSSSVTLEVKKNSGNENDLSNYVFVFKNDTENAVIVGNDENTPLFTLRKDMNLEFKIKNVNDKWSLEKVWNKDRITERVGLVCEANDECTLGSGEKITIKQNSNKSSEMPTLSITSPSKIKLQRDSKGYNQGLRFNIEGGDIALNNAGNNITKLEKNESYQIEQDGEKWILSRKNTALEGFNEKLKRLGLSDKCKFSDSETSKECSDLDSNEMKKVKFSGKGEINLTSTSEKFKLKIEKNTTDTSVFGEEKLRFSFTTFPADVTVPQSSGKTITLKKGTNPEFKIKEKDGNWTLERAWDINKLAGKIGLSCTTKDKKCSFKSDQKINVFKSNGNYAIDADINSSDISKKITYTEEAENYNQGFKFTVEAAIGITGGTQKPDGTSITQIEVTTYEIKEQIVDGTNKWFLSEKSSN